MKRWLGDTLFKRLFALMWLALVVSHVVAFLAATHGMGLPRGGHFPTFPSLPPFPVTQPSTTQSPDARRPGGMGERGEPPPFERGTGLPPPPGDGGRPGGPPRGDDAPPPDSGGPGLSASLVLLDYGIRLVIIGLAAWMGARWLSRPMRKLASASGSLHEALVRNGVPARMDERSGTVEVRETARMFNEMSQQLVELVNERALLVAAISHDLRTPLTRIRMRLEQEENGPLAARSIADIHEMDALIESALDVFRGPGHEEAAQVTDVLALVQSLTDDLADLGQPVTLTGQPALARIHPAAMRRVVGNLVSNALRYGVRAELQVRTAGSQVEIVVDDAGPGIPRAQLEAVMRPFFRLESSRNRATGGSGLGLYIARDLVTRQGGTLVLANRDEGGLRATITLPKA